MTLVVDASVAVKWFVREQDTEQARQLLTIPDSLIAPDWLLVEAASTFWKKIKRSELLVIHAERHLDEMPNFFEQLYPSAPLVAKAFSWSLRLKHSVYDCIYLALALQESCKLVTADAKFAEVVSSAGLSDIVEVLA